MIWVLVDVVLVVVVLAALGALGWQLWTSVKALGGAVGRMGDVVGDASPGLEVVTPPARDLTGS